jgi:hypothetical protein
MSYWWERNPAKDGKCSIVCRRENLKELWDENDFIFNPGSLLN